MNKDSRYLTFWKITCCFSFFLFLVFYALALSRQISSAVSCMHTPRQNIWTERYFGRQKGWNYMKFMNKSLCLFSIDRIYMHLLSSMRLELDNFIAWLRVLIHFVLNHLRCRLIISTYQYHGLSESAAEMKIICVNFKL